MTKGTTGSRVTKKRTLIPLVGLLVVQLFACATTDFQARPSKVSISLGLIELLPGAQHILLELKKKDPLAEIEICAQVASCTKFRQRENAIAFLSLPGERVYQYRVRGCSGNKKVTCGQWQSGAFFQPKNPYARGDNVEKPQVWSNGRLVIATEPKIVAEIVGAAFATWYANRALNLSYSLVGLDSEARRPLDILQTNDLHSHGEQYVALEEAIAESKRIADVQGRDVIVVDAGDWFSGGIHGIISVQDPLPLGDRSKGGILAEVLELEHFAKTGAIATLGNHEFDAHGGLINIFKKAALAGFTGRIVATNMILEEKAPLRAYYSEKVFIPGQTDEAKPIHKSIIQNVNGLKVGYIGVMGKNADTGSRTNRKGTGIHFHHSRKKLQREVDQLKKQGADVVVCLLHGGENEDESLARKVKGIDFIAAGHTHATYGARKVEGTTTFSAQAGAHGRTFSAHSFWVPLAKSKKRDWTKGIHLEKETMVKPLRAKVSNQARQLWQKNRIDTILKEAGYDERYATDSARVIYEHTGPRFAIEIYEKGTSKQRSVDDFLTDETGKLVTSAIHAELNQFLAKEQPDAKKVDLFFTALQLIREDVWEPGQKITFQDVFQMVSSGMEPKAEGLTPRIGAELVYFDVPKAQLRNILTMLEIASRFMPEAVPAFSNALEYKVRKYAPPFAGRIYDIKVGGIPYSHLPKVVRIATTKFMAENTRVWGLFTPRNITPIEVRGEELFARFLEKDGIPYKNGRIDFDAPPLKPQVLASNLTPDPRGLLGRNQKRIGFVVLAAGLAIPLFAYQAHRVSN